jgi:spore coat polysaccharide biosynthesis protein SpsF
MNIALIQARMASTRLPGKVLLPILDKPVLWHIHNRLKYSTKIDKICISTSTDISDDPIETFAKNNNILCYRGSPDNLVSRHLDAAKLFNADLIVRITADDPLVDPKIIDELITLYEKNHRLHFLSNSKDHTYPVGLEVEIFPICTLENLLPISNNPIFYEFFISNYILEHPEKFRTAHITLNSPKNQRWTLDYPEDYEFIKQIFSNLFKKSEIFHMDEILDFLEKNPHLLQINTMHYSEFSHLKYKKLKDVN